VLNDVSAVARRLGGRLVLTPNAEEATRLLGGDPDGTPDRDQDAVAEQATAVARRFDALVCCHNVIADPTGRLWFGSSGHGGLGTSGSGDVLAGAIGGLLARGADLDQAACWGSHLHTTAGDRLAIEIGPLGFLARELVNRLPAVMAELTTV
jgi:NAD(P)H-hydrate repair Nnr-like enzyme with NAD(P)H-hydrate dehydratase domain